MKKFITVLLFILIMGLFTMDAKTTNRTGKKFKASKTAPINYKFETTEEGIKSPLGKTYYLGKLGWNNEKCYMSFITPDKVEIYVGPKSERIRVQHAWKQDGNYIFISDSEEPLKINDDGKSLTGVYTDSDYNISGNAPIKEKNAKNKIYSGSYTWWLGPEGKIVSSTYPDQDSPTERMANCTKLTDDIYLLSEFFEESPTFLTVDNKIYRITGFNKDRKLEKGRSGDYILDGYDSFSYNPEDKTVTIKNGKHYTLALSTRNYNNVSTFTLPLDYFEIVSDLTPKFLINNNVAYEFEHFRKDKECEENDWENLYNLQSCANVEFNPQKMTVTLKDVHATNYNTGHNLNTPSLTLPLNYFQKTAKLWEPGKNDIKTNPKMGKFTLNGIKYVITEKGQVYSSNRDQYGSIHKVNESAYLIYIGYGSILPADSYDAYLVVDNVLYSMPTDTGEEIKINYDPTSKNVIITSSEGYYNETKPLSKYSKAATIYILKDLQKS